MESKRKINNISATSKYVAYGVLLLIASGYYVYYKGKNNGNTYVPLPENSNSSETEASQVRSLSLKLHNEMKGISLSSSVDAFKNYIATTDRIFVAVYNDFNKMYQSEGNGTLRDWINDEYWGLFDNSNKAIKESIISRMDSLNLQ